MELAQNTFYTYTGEKGEKGCWWLRFYEEGGFPVVVLVVPFPVVGTAGMGRLLETAPREVAGMLARIEGKEQCCWWIEQEPGAEEHWAACFDGKSVMEIRRGDLEYLPAWQPLERKVVERMVSP
jgi:hypothetical protein